MKFKAKHRLMRTTFTEAVRFSSPKTANDSGFSVIDIEQAFKIKKAVPDLSKMCARKDEELTRERRKELAEEKQRAEI